MERFEETRGHLGNGARYDRPGDSWWGTERIRVQTREWLLTAAVIVIPLIIAVVVTMWSLEQVRYRPKKRRPASAAARETGPPADRGDEPGESGVS